MKQREAQLAQQLQGIEGVPMSFNEYQQVKEHVQDQAIPQAPSSAATSTAHPTAEPHPVIVRSGAHVVEASVVSAPSGHTGHAPPAAAAHVQVQQAKAAAPHVSSFDGGVVAPVKAQTPVDAPVAVNAVAAAAEAAEAEVDRAAAEFTQLQQ